MVWRVNAPSSSLAIREQVAAASRKLAAAGLVIGSGGNVSARHGELVAVTATGGELEQLSADQVTIVDLDGNVVEGDLAPTSEIELHLGAYRRFGTGAVVHTHAPVATALACVLDDELPCVHYQMLMLGGAVPVASYRTFGTPELAETTLDALEGHMAVLMANHGTLTLGNDLQQAVSNSVLLEWAATVYWRAASIGSPRALNEEERMAVINAAVTRSYGTLQEVEQ
jgi:L-fuculose-phosphate aldolase